MLVGVALDEPAMNALPALAFLALGITIGAAHFAMLARDAGLLLGGAPIWRMLCLRGSRFLLTGAMLLLAARCGAVPLLATLAGLLLARRWALKSYGSTA